MNKLKSLDIDGGLGPDQSIIPSRESGGGGPLKPFRTQRDYLLRM